MIHIDTKNMRTEMIYIDDKNISAPLGARVPEGNIEIRSALPAGFVQAAAHAPLAPGGGGGGGEAQGGAGGGGGAQGGG